MGKLYSPKVLLYNFLMEVRINKFLAEAGIGSRRQNEQAIRDGKVTVNGRRAELGEFIDPNADVVIYDGKRVATQPKLIYIMLNKPVGIISSVKDERGRKTVLDLVKTKERIYPVGRLDYNSSGLILLTNDGDLVLKLTHPRYHLPKKYLVEVDRPILDDNLKKLEAGILLDGKMTLPAKTRRFTKTKFEITLHQGLKRQIRLMCKSLGYEALHLHRTDIGPLNIGNLKSGQYRHLTVKEIASLKKC